MTENEIGKITLDSAFDVYRELGSGLPENVYEVVWRLSLLQRGLSVQWQVPVTIRYRGMTFDEAFRGDRVVQEKLVAHKRQTYLGLTGYKPGFLLNFGEALMKCGITVSEWIR